MRLALFGATGLTGPAVLREALARGHEVRVLARNPAAVAAHERLAIVQGSALDRAAVEACVEGCEVALHCLGIGGRGDGKPTTLVSESVQLLVPVMRERGVRRLVVMSNVGAGGTPFWLRRIVMPLFVRWLVPIVEDKDRMEAYLATTEIEWVAPRFPEIVEGPSKPLRRRGIRITTGSVATFMLDHLTDPTHLRGVPAVSN